MLKTAEILFSRFSLKIPLFTTPKAPPETDVDGDDGTVPAVQLVVSGAEHEDEDGSAKMELVRDPI